jgi:hypothetical protein
MKVVRNQSLNIDKKGIFSRQNAPDPLTMLYLVFPIALSGIESLDGMQARLCSISGSHFLWSHAIAAWHKEMKT